MLKLVENFIVIPTFVFSALVCWVVYRVSLKIALITAVVLFVWFNLVFWLGKTGFFTIDSLFVPNIVFGFLILFELGRRMLSVTEFQKTALKLSITWLVLIQTYRVVGISFIFLYLDGVLPAVFAFPSAVGDIIVGVSAPLVAFLYYAKKSYSREIAIVWNVFGIADLVIAVAMGILAFSRPIRFLPIAIATISTEPLSLYPLVMISLFAVPLALILHVLSLKILKVGKIN